jgi:hypothetical protein
MEVVEGGFLLMVGRILGVEEDRLQEGRKSY